MQGSVANAAQEALSNGYGTFQMFVTNPRSWAIGEINGNDSLMFKELVRKSHAMPFAHASYLCNPSSPKDDIHRKTISSLKGNMENCARLGIRYLVIHIGSHLGAGHVAALRNSAETISHVIDTTSGVELLLENSAGYTNSFGSDFKEIAKIMDEIGREKVGVCLDTCHAYAYGYDIATAAGTAALMDEIEQAVGMRSVKLVHLNDSKYQLGSHLDRHWHIGKGHIGRQGFIDFFRNMRLKTDCFVMETPEDEYGDRESDMRAALSIIEETRLGRV